MFRHLWAAVAVVAFPAVASLVLPSASRASSEQGECIVKNAMRYMDLPEGSFALSKGSMKATEIETVLTPVTNMERGKMYTVLLDRWANNVYRDERTRLVLLTEFCTESATATRATFRFTGNESPKLPVGKILWP